MQNNNNNDDNNNNNNNNNNDFNNNNNNFDNNDKATSAENWCKNPLTNVPDLVKPVTLVQSHFSRRIRWIYTVGCQTQHFYLEIPKTGYRLF